jgi:hypothetical protein
VLKYIELSSVTDTAFLALVVSGVSVAMENHIGRSIASTAYTAEIHDGDGFSGEFVLKHRPILASPALVMYEDATDSPAVVASDQYRVDLDAGVVILRNWKQHDAVGYYSFSYTAGYATTPKDLEFACIKQVVYEWNKSKPGGSLRLGKKGKVLDGGSSEYVLDPWVDGVEEVMQRYKEL